MFDACKAAGVPCGIFTMSAEAAAKRRDEGYALVTVANDIDVVSRGFKAAMAKFQDSAAAHGHNASTKEQRNVERASRPVRRRRSRTAASASST